MRLKTRLVANAETEVMVEVVNSGLPSSRRLPSSGVHLSVVAMLTVCSRRQLDGQLASWDCDMDCGR
mgnify:FL=1